MVWTKGNIPWNKGLTEETSLVIAAQAEQHTGYKHTLESRKKMREAHRGRSPWNKGLTKETDPRVMKYARSLVGRKSSLITRLKLSKAMLSKPGMKGESNPMFGKRGPLSPFYGKPRPEYVKRILSTKQKEAWKNGLHPRQRPAQSHLMKEKWKDPEYKRTVITKTLRGLLKRPTSLEKKYMGPLKDIGFDYVGDGRFWVSNMNPDFKHKYAPIVVEVGLKYFHRDPWAVERIQRFRENGYDCFTFFEDSTVSEVLDTVLGFLEGEQYG